MLLEERQLLQRSAKLPCKRNASFASAVHTTANPSVCLSVRHTPLLCQNEGTQRDAVFTHDHVVAQCL